MAAMDKVAFLGRDARALIGDLEDQSVILPASGHHDLPAGWRMADGVVQQVEDDLLEPVAIGHHLGSVRVH